MARGWSVSLLVLGVLTVLLGIFMWTLQVCVLAITTPTGVECVQWYPAFLFSGGFTIFMGGMMVLWGAVSWNE